MTRLRSLTLGLTLAVAATFTGCGDSVPIAPSPDGPAFARGHGYGNRAKGKNGLRVLKEDEYRKNAVSVTETIGRAGGTLSAAGVRLDVPAGALDADVEITMTVPKGSYLEAHFQPHGLEFDKAATLTMKLKGALPEQANEAAVEAIGKVRKDIQSGLQGVYFEGTLGEDAVAREILDVVADEDRARLDIRHFSGYCVATG